MGWQRLVSLRDDELPNQCDERSRQGWLGGVMGKDPQ